MKKIVIFGAFGHLGMYFTDYCYDRMRGKYEIVAVGRNIRRVFDEEIETVQLDVTSDNDFNKLPEKDVFAIVNLVGLVPAYSSDISYFDYLDVNVKGSLRIMEYARKVGADRVIYTQTWTELYGHFSETVLKSDMTRSLPLTGDHAFYAITKSTVSDMMKHYSAQYGIKHFIFRLPNVYMYSPDMYYYLNGERKVVSYRYMIEQASGGNDLELWGDTDAFMDILYVKDLCKMMYLSLLSDVDSGTYNAGTGIRTTMRDQIQGIVDVFSGGKSNIILRPDMPTHLSFVMDIDDAKKDLGYEPEYSYIGYLEDYKKEREAWRYSGRN